ncbi:MAG: hypothetical protein BWY88_00705 [Synergistetes bacterium ADurb.Bin520]|nr:MAG: hypothetical protein BWY88_00705 [Synergistetes bacterium ADurb.Bin520]
MLAKRRCFPGAIGALAGVGVSHGFRRVYQKGHPRFKARPRQRPGLAEIRQAPPLPRGEDLSHSQKPRLATAQHLFFHLPVQGGHHRQGNDAPGKAPRRVHHVVVALPTEPHVLKAEAADPGTIHSIGIHAGHQVLGLGPPMHGAPGQGVEVGLPGGDALPGRHHGRGIDVHMGVDDHDGPSSFAPRSRVSRTTPMFFMISWAISGLFMV